LVQQLLQRVAPGNGRFATTALVKSRDTITSAPTRLPLRKVASFMMPTCSLSYLATSLAREEAP
jgi:hypothetical protein